MKQTHFAYCTDTCSYSKRIMIRPVNQSGLLWKLISGSKILFSL